jgi:hypothetical protein
MTGPAWEQHYDATNTGTAQQTQSPMNEMPAAMNGGCLIA